MNREGVLVSRLVAIALVLIMSLSMARAAGDGEGSDQVAYTEASVDEYVRVGWLGSVYSWNPFTLTLVEDYVACYLIHSTLFTYGEDWDGPVGDLALDWSMEPQADGTMDTYITITNNAYFRGLADPTDTTRSLTAYDAKYTLDLIRTNPGTTFGWYLKDITEIRVLGDYELVVTTSFVKATIIDDLAGIPIVPEYLYSTLSNPMGSLDPSDLVGSGPFLFEGLLEGSWCMFTKAPNYHGEADYGAARTVDVPGIIYVSYSDSTALAMAMNAGDLDAISIGEDVNTYTEVLGAMSSVNVIKQAVSEPGICDVAINAIPMSFRTPTYGDGNPLLLDPVVRQALMMTLDKSYIVDVILQGLAQPADSVLQPGFWKADIDELAFDPAAAMDLLIANGYSDLDGDGFLQATADSYVVQQGLAPVGAELSGIRCEAPDTSPIYYSIAAVWTGDAADAGIGLAPAMKSEGIMINTAWYKADYDIWVWHWAWGPEPIGSALSTWVTSEIAPGGLNCQGPMGPWWYGPDNYTDAPAEWGLDGPYSAYDQNLSVAEQTLDTAERKVILDKLQQWVYDSCTENPPYYDIGLYAYSDARFVGWGDWVAHPGRTVNSDLLWLWFDLAPRGDNLPPVFDVALAPSYETVVGTETMFEVVVSDPDGDALWVNWSFGDGETVWVEYYGDTSVPTEMIQSHAYLMPAAGLELWVTIDDGLPGHQVLSTASVDVIEVLPDQRTVRYQWGNMFGEPFGEWWDWRYNYYGNWEVVSDSYPYIYRMLNGSASTYFSNMQLNVVADNLPEVNMNSDPQFLPCLGEERGGTAVIDWYMQYLTEAEMQLYPENTAAWYDGWVIGLNGTTLLDGAAAKTVLGISDADLDDFDVWWNANEVGVEYDYIDWMIYEANERLDIFPMYDYPFMPMSFNLDAWSYNGSVVLEYDIVTWGMEALMTRWLHDAFMPTEWLFEDFSLHAEITPDMADIEIDTAVMGAVFAWKDIATEQPSWAWRGMLQDYVPSSAAHPGSDFDAYVDLEYLDMYAGNTWYGEMMSYDYTPGAFNLADGEEMWFEWPDGPQTFIVDGQFRDFTTADFSIQSPYSEPAYSDLPECVSVDPLLNTISFEGPVDVYSWSVNQTAHDYLESEWDRLGVLPYGMPWIEFKAATEPSEPAMIVLDMLHHAEVNQTVGINVTIADENWVPCVDYTGTLTFSSTDLSAVLPADYTFTPEDAGTHYFEFTFYTEGEQWLTVQDTADPALVASTWFYVYPPSEADAYEPDDYYELANVILMDELQEHSIIPEWDVDWVTFTLAEDTCVGIRTFINGSGDTVIALFDQYGVPYSPIASDDDSGGGLSSLITADLPAGTYWVAVWAFGNYQEIPAYYLWVYETDIVNLPPYVYISWWPYEPAPGQEVFFDGGGSYDPDGWITDWLWDFGDNTTSEGAWLNHTYLEAGEYYVTLTVVDNDGGTTSGTVLVCVSDNEEPVASLTYAPPNPAPGETVYFDASGSYDPDGWIEYYVFDFGDGTCDYTWYPHVTHTYYQEGVYTVTLTVYDSNWIWNSTSVEVRVGLGGAPPVAIIAYEPSMPLVGDAVAFDASYSFDPDGTIVSYTWQFGDGDVAEGITAAHAYEHEGVYDVKLTVMDGDLLVDEDVVSITVASVPAPAMVYSPLDPDEGELVTFYAYGSYDEGGIVEYVWSFGDGTYASGWEAAHVFAEQGSYDVTLTVTNIYGVQASVTVEVDVGKGDSGVKGTVMSESLRPIKNAVVEVRTSNGVLVGSTLTDSSGQFMIRGLVPGVYDLSVSKNGYETVTISVTISEGILDVGTVVLLDGKGSDSAVAGSEDDSIWLVGAAGLIGVAMLGGFLVSRKKDSGQ